MRLERGNTLGEGIKANSVLLTAGVIWRAGGCEGRLEMLRKVLKKFGFGGEGSSEVSAQESSMCVFCS